MKTTKTKLSIPVILGLGIIAGLPAMESVRASTVTVNAGNSGSYNIGGFANNTVGSHQITVNQGMAGVNDKRAWIDFDLTGVSGLDIVGAILQIPSSKYNGSGQTINFWDVLLPSGSLGTGWSTAAFADLGSGVSYGSGVHTAGTLNSFALNAAAIAALNSTESHWDIGVQNTGNTYAFGYAPGAPTDIIQLILDIRDPEPPPQNQQVASVPDGGSTFAMMGVAVSGLFAFRRFSKKS